MPQHIAEKIRFLQLLERREGETNSDSLSGCGELACKFVSFRGNRLQLLCPATKERDDIATSLTPSITLIRNIMQYQVRLLVQGVAASTVQAILSSSVSSSMTSSMTHSTRG
ncbi:unnamed protein product [Peronospora effusa]|nr:unnamed protein product [Peronospora effusa]